MTASSMTDLDPVALEIIWSRLIAVAEEQSVTVRRTAFSNIVRESYDYSCVVLSRTGDLLAQPFQSMPAFNRCASVVMKSFLEKWPDWHPGDVAITNDPWLAAGHLHDIALAVPVFHKGKLVAFSANIAHQADIGGRGYSADANSIYEEGLALPPLKLYRAGEPVQEVLDIIAENVRVPDQVLGDIHVQIAAARLGADRITELMAEHDLDDLDGIAATICGRSEAAMRTAIERVPDGVYENEGMLDGFDSPLAIRVRLTIRGDEIDYDFAGTSPQVPKGINCCFNYSFGYVSFATKAALEPRVPNNEGCFRPLRMTVPEASLLNSKRPAPGNSRGRVGHMIVPVVFGALAKALPDAIPAEPGAPAPRANFFGSLDDGREFQCLLITSGGLGAQAHRDGLACKAFPTNTTMASLEIMELSAPIRFHKRELIANSGGPGKYRGGLGQEIVVEAVGSKPVYVSTSVEKMNNPPLGYQGGADGAPAGLWKNINEYLPPKARSMLQPGDTVTIRTPGGGGFGPAAKRAPADIRSDAAAGYISTALEVNGGRSPSQNGPKGQKPS